MMMSTIILFIPIASSEALMNSAIAIADWKSQVGCSALKFTGCKAVTYKPLLFSCPLLTTDLLMTTLQRLVMSIAIVMEKSTSGKE